MVKSTVRNSSKYSPIPYLDLHIQSVTILCCATSQFISEEAMLSVSGSAEGATSVPGRSGLVWVAVQCCVSVMFHVQRTVAGVLSRYLDIYVDI